MSERTKGFVPVFQHLLVAIVKKLLGLSFKTLILQASVTLPLLQHCSRISCYQKTKYMAQMNKFCELVIVPSASVISSPCPNIALVLRVLVVFEGVLVELDLANFLNVKDAMSCKLLHNH